jgi:hypothetical protein
VPCDYKEGLQYFGDDGDAIGDVGEYFGEEGESWVGARQTRISMILAPMNE